MRYAIFSDIHGNWQAWNAVLADMYDSNVDVPVCLGDIVGYGPCPQKVLDGIRDVTGNFVMGNHDAAATGVIDPHMFNDQARAVIEWTAEQLDKSAKKFLREMPMVIEDGDLMFVHAEIEEPGRFLYIDSEDEAADNFCHTDQRITFVGHTHNPAIFCENPDGTATRHEDRDCVLQNGKRYIINVGSVGEPRNPEDIRARYVLYDSETNELTFRRVEFDVEAYRADLRKSGLTITPYFLTVVDSYQEAVAMARRVQLMRDMRTTRHAPQQLRHRKTSPHAVNAVQRPLRRERLPTPYVPPPKSRAALLISLVILAAALASLTFVFFGGERRPEWAKVSVDHFTGNDEVPVVSEVKTTPDSIPVPKAAPPIAEHFRIGEIKDPDSVTPLPSLAGRMAFYASFDEPADTTVFSDLSTEGRNFKRGKTRIAPGIAGNAVYFSGDKIVSRPIATERYPSSSVAFWLRLDKNLLKTNNPIRAFSMGGNYSFYYHADRFQTSPAPDPKTDVSEIPGGHWIHFIVITDSGKKCQIYVNGKKWKTHRSIKREIKKSEKMSVSLGGTGAHFMVDEVAVWNRVLKANEITNVFQLGALGKPLRIPPRSYHWDFDTDTKPLSGGIPLLTTESSSAQTTVVEVAPKVIPLTYRKNSGAMRVNQLHAPEENAAIFQLKPNRGFSYEGWFLPVSGNQTTLGSTLETVTGPTGWKLELVPRKEGLGDIVFKIQKDKDAAISVIAKDQVIYDLKAHHIAAVWNRSTPNKPKKSKDTFGELTLFLDGRPVAKRVINHKDIPVGDPNPFYLGDPGQDLLVDEIRFTPSAIYSRNFLIGIVPQK